MPLPKKVKKNISLTEPEILIGRRRELLDKINKDGTYLPKSILHADLDGGFLDFVKEDLKLVVDGKTVPTVDIIITSQNWIQFTQTWTFQNEDKNIEPPFITVVRTPEVKYGSNPSTLYTIPNRRQFFYAQVPTWDGQRAGLDIYKIPQPVPIDITFQVKIVCNRMRELNRFNKIILEKFSSKQSYSVIKGHYIPIVMGGITDESVMDIERRKYYIQSYEFTMLGFLIDEDEFTVSPAVSRVLQVFETEKKTTKRQGKKIEENSSTNLDVIFLTGVTTTHQLFDYTTNLTIGKTKNISSYDIFINNEYYGSDISEVQINTKDVLKIVVVKDDDTKESNISIVSKLI